MANQSSGDDDFPAGQREESGESQPEEVQHVAGAAESDDQRLSASVLLLGGLSLLLLGQTTSTVVTGRERFWVYLITILGAIAFLLGGSFVAKRTNPKFVRQPVDWLAGRLQIASGQVFLLVMALLLALLASYAAGEAQLARLPIISAVAWLLAILMASAGMIRSAADIPPRIDRREIVFTALIFALALLLRGVATERIPTTFSGDEGAAGLSAVQFANGAANNLFTVGWFDFPSLYFALQSLGVRILGQTVPALRVVSALGGALTVVACYWLARVMFNIFIARLAALILMASHFHIHMSRIALNNIWDGLFAALAAFGLWYGWQSGRRFGFVICGLALGLGQYFYVTVRILPLLLLVWAAAAWLVERQRFQQRLPGLILSAYLTLITILPMGLYYARHFDQYMARIRPVAMTGNMSTPQATEAGASMAQVIFQQLTKAMGGFVFEPLRLLYDPGAPLLLVSAAALFLIGVLWALFNPDLRYLLLLLPLAATIFIVAVSNNAPSSQRYVLAAPFVVIFVALPLGLLREWLDELWPQYSRWAAIPAIFMVTWLLFADLRYYFTQVYSDGYILGGVNTLVATQVADYLQQQTSTEDVYFYGFPRMGYRSHATIAYLVPHVRGHDVEPDGGVPTPAIIRGTTQFIFLPERLQELQYVLSLYTQGNYREFFNADNELLFAVYEIIGP